MRYRIEYPDDWIGIPEVGEGREFTTARAWADAVVAHISAHGGFLARTRGVHAGLGDALTVITEGLVSEGAHAGYVWPETLDGPYRFVAVYGFDRDDLGDATAADLAGAAGEHDYVPPLVSAVATLSGAEGVYVERHAPYDQDAPHVATVVGAYAFERPDGIVLMQSSTTDLAAFERFRPRYEEFARTFRWDD